MRFATDGFLDLRDSGIVRMPGAHDEELDALPERRALSFLLSHSFKGARTIVRPLSEAKRRMLRRAQWADCIGHRMDLVDRVWREITEPVDGIASGDEPQLLQIILYGDLWAYPLYLVGDRTEVAPEGGLPVGKVKRQKGTPRIDLQSA